MLLHIYVTVVDSEGIWVCRQVTCVICRKWGPGPTGILTLLVSILVLYSFLRVLFGRTEVFYM